MAESYQKMSKIAIGPIGGLFAGFASAAGRQRLWFFFLRLAHFLGLFLLAFCHDASPLNFELNNKFEQLPPARLTCSKAANI